MQLDTTVEQRLRELE
jgi:flagellar biosynthesis chaperone FliJ